MQTNVASTFKGVIRALREFAPQLIEHNVQIWVRRAGPNYQEGLKNIKAAGDELKLQMKVYGPEMGVAEVVPVALSKLLCPLSKTCLLANLGFLFKFKKK